MKHKKIKMIISFLLALVLLVSLPLDIQANAVALEGWAIYALISYLAAMGITFTVSGGVDALLKAVQEKTDEYIKVTGIDLLGLIYQSVTIRGGGNGGGWWFGFAAAAAVMEFIQWLRDNGWANGETLTQSSQYATWPALIDGIPSTARSSIIEYDSSITVSGTNYDRYKIIDYGTCIIANKSIAAGAYFDSSQYKVENADGTYYYFKLNYNNWSNIRAYRNDIAGGYNSYKWLKGSDAYGNDFQNNVIGLTFGVIDGDVTWGPYCDDGFYYPTYSAIYNHTFTYFSNETIVSIPEEFPDVSPSEDEGVLIDTGADVSTLTTPEELAENIKQIFDDTGTITKPTVTVEKDSTITPTPPPEVTPEIEDIDDLGLPALGEAIKNKFPFCLPSDLRDLISLLVAEPVTPKWEVDLYEWFDGKLAGDTTFGIDLAEYEVLGQISRWASVISFSIFLLLITKGMIGW